MSHPEPPSDWITQVLGVVDSTVVAVVVGVGAVVSAIAAVLIAPLRARLTALEERQERTDGTISELRAENREDLSEIKADVRQLLDLQLRREPVRRE